MEIISRSPEETGTLGCRLGSLLRMGDVIFLGGGLGAGKTRFAQGIAAGLGAAGARSPSFALLHCYRASIPVYHADLYRLDGPSELEVLDLNETTADGVLIVEWGGLAEKEFPERLDVELVLHQASENARTIRLSPIGLRYCELAQRMMDFADPGS